MDAFIGQIMLFAGNFAMKGWAPEFIPALS